MAATHAQLKRGMPEEEDATQLKFNEGPTSSFSRLQLLSRICSAADFRDAQCLFVSEVKLVLDEQQQTKSKEGLEYTITP